MAYSYYNSRGQTYYLHYKDVMMRRIKYRSRIYFFKKELGENQVDFLPANYSIMECGNSKLPILKKS